MFVLIAILLMILIKLANYAQIIVFHVKIIVLLALHVKVIIYYM
mgnify:CR=1 FL=1